MRDGRVAIMGDTWMADVQIPKFLRKCKKYKKKGKGNSSVKAEKNTRENETETAQTEDTSEVLQVIQEHIEFEPGQEHVPQNKEILASMRQARKNMRLHRVSQTMSLNPKPGGKQK